MSNQGKKFWVWAKIFGAYKEKRGRLGSSPRLYLWFLFWFSYFCVSSLSQQSGRRRFGSRKLQPLFHQFPIDWIIMVTEVIKGGIIRDFPNHRSMIRSKPQDIEVFSQVFPSLRSVFSKSLLVFFNELLKFLHFVLFYVEVRNPQHVLHLFLSP